MAALEEVHSSIFILYQRSNVQDWMKPGQDALMTRVMANELSGTRSNLTAKLDSRLAAVLQGHLRKHDIGPCQQGQEEIRAVQGQLSNCNKVSDILLKGATVSMQV